MLTDIMIFGYPDDKEAPILQEDFIEEITKKFPDVELRDTYDNIKGYRQEIHFNNNENDNYFAFLFGMHWQSFSLTLNLSILSEKSDVKKWIDLAKKQYSEKFKNE